MPNLRKHFLKEKLGANDIKNSISEAFSDLMKYCWNNEERKESTLQLKLNLKYIIKINNFKKSN